MRRVGEFFAGFLRAVQALCGGGDLPIPEFAAVGEKNDCGGLNKVQSGKRQSLVRVRMVAAVSAERQQPAPIFSTAGDR